MWFISLMVVLTIFLFIYSSLAISNDYDDTTSYNKKNVTYNAKNYAIYIINNCNLKNIDIDNRSLQNMLVHINFYFIDHFNSPAFNDKIITDKTTKSKYIEDIYLNFDIIKDIANTYDKDKLLCNLSLNKKEILDGIIEGFIISKEK